MDLDSDTTPRRTAGVFGRNSTSRGYGQFPVEHAALLPKIKTLEKGDEALDNRFVAFSEA